MDAATTKKENQKMDIPFSQIENITTRHQWADFYVGNILAVHPDNQVRSAVRFLRPYIEWLRKRKPEPIQLELEDL